MPDERDGVFKSREQLAGGWPERRVFAPAFAAPASLSIADVLAIQPNNGATIRRAPRKDVAQRLHELRYQHLPALREVDWVPDLAIDIGSARWFRGLGTMLGLTCAALLFWPDFAPVEAAPTMRLDTTTRDEFRSQMIMPLGLGGDSGRRMGATAAVIPLASAPERPTVQLTATLGQGDSFGRMLQRAGVGGDEAARITEMVAARVPLGDIAPGTRFDLTLGRRASPDRPRPVDDLAFRARFDLELAVERRGGSGLGALALVVKPIAVDATPLRIRGIVGSSLYRSARAAGAPAKAIQQYLRTLDSHLNLESDIAASDEFDIVIGYKRAASGEVEVGDLMYAGVERDGKPRAQLLKWGPKNGEGDGQFFEASGVGKTQAGLGAPVAGRITSGYGVRRHPILGYTRMHAGIDFKAAYGAPIYATADGIVAFAGRHGGHGNFVKLAHGGGVGTGYGHMSRIAVSPGARVRQGQVIGYVGSTGLSTGPHLHYELYKGGRAVNPGSVRFIARAQLEGHELAAFRARLASLREVKPGAALASLAPAQAGDAPRREIDRLSMATDH
ncbi:MAG TPA: M23 family metallopeptidase [Novosphingobium sp.]|nr:M23 family metallopeptidase [Novosphingobium sp.]